MYTIFKYKLPITDDVVEIELPKSNLLLSIKAQGNNICMWAMVGSDTPTEKRRFKIMGTGHEIEDARNLYFLSTVIMPNDLVWHIFEVRT